MKTLSDPETKEEVKEFERRYLQYLEDSPDRFPWQNKIYSHLVWFESMGAIRIKGDTTKSPTGDNLWNTEYKIVNNELYKDLQVKWSLLNRLRWMRERAKENDTPPIEEMSEEINSIDSKEINVEELEF